MTKRSVHCLGVENIVKTDQGEIITISLFRLDRSITPLGSSDSLTSFDEYCEDQPTVFLSPEALKPCLQNSSRHDDQLRCSGLINLNDEVFTIYP